MKIVSEPGLPPNFAELVQKQVVVLLFALSTNRSGLAIKICERLAGTEFFSWDCSYFGTIPRGGFKQITEQLEYMIQSLHRYAGIGDPYLRKFLELLSEKDLWKVTL